MKQEFKYSRAVYVALGPYVLYKNLLIKSFIFTEMNTSGLPKFSKISVAFNIFILIPAQEMVYSKAIQKNHLNGRFCVWNDQSKMYLKKFRGSSSPFPPLDPPMACNLQSACD